MLSAIRTQSAMPWCSAISTDCFTSVWDSRGISFVVRLRKDIKFTHKKAFPQPDDREQDILVDEAIELIGDDTSKNILTLCGAWLFTARMTLRAVNQDR